MVPFLHESKKSSQKTNVSIFSVMNNQRRNWIMRSLVNHNSSENDVKALGRIRRISTGTLIHPSVTASTLTNMQTRISHNLCLEDGNGTPV